MAVKQTRKNNPTHVPSENKDHSSIATEAVVAGDQYDPLAPLDFEATEAENETHEKLPEEMLSKSEVTALLEAQERRLMALINSQPAGGTPVTPKSKADKSYVTSLLNDYLDEPIIYFAYSTGFFYHGDYRNGKESLPPDGSVEFKPVIRMRRASKTGGQQTISVSSCKIHSKAQSEWLESSPMFGIRFHKQVDEVANIDAMWANKLVEANTAISRLPDVQIISRCKDLGLRITEDVPAMRRALVNHLAKESRSLEERVAAQTREKIANYQESNVDGDVALRHVITHS